MSSRMMIGPVVAAVAVAAAALAVGPATGEERHTMDRMKVFSVEHGRMVEVDRVELEPAEWRARLTPEQFEIAREEGTERAFTGPFWDAKAEGVYRCAACGNDLFLSTTKFDSGTGWPSFYAPVHEANVGTRTDRKLWMVRTEVHCARCGAHLGHVFEDGPAPTGLRYCLNGTVLDFEPMDVDRDGVVSTR